MSTTTSISTGSQSVKAGVSRQNMAHRGSRTGNRTLLSGALLRSSAGMIGKIAGTANYMYAAGVPLALLPLFILTELGGSQRIIASLKTHVVAFLLGGFTLLMGVIFHTNFADQTQMILFLKNVSIAGAFLLLAAYSVWQVSIDNWRKSNADSCIRLAGGRDHDSALARVVT